ncbi:MAG: hypothetical protein ACRC33_21095 [Gemmataceae bacterium]
MTPSRPHPFWRYLKATLIFLVVAWHLFFFAVRNPLDLWDDEIVAWLTKRGYYAREGGGPPRHFNLRPAYRFADELTYRFANTAGVEQRWVMFTPPMAQRAPFLSVRFEFDDGSTALVPSPNEPVPARFFRFGLWQTRKHEDTLLSVPDLKGDANPEWPMWVQFVRHAVKRWRDRHPADGRAVERVVLVKRTISFPKPDEPAGVYGYEEKDLATFGPEGDIP